MSNAELEDLEKAANKNPTMPSPVVIRLISELLQSRWETENYRKLAAHYKGDADVGAAVGVRAVAS